MKILGTGLSGLVGTRIVELLSGKGYEFEDLSKDTGIDITDYSTVNRRIAHSDAPWIFHLAAHTDVQGAEKERTLGDTGLSWRVNVDATANIVSVCRKIGKRILFLSTDYVFDGTKSVYTEEDTPNPQGWYAMTKYEGEKSVLSLSSSGLVVRIANPYRANPAGKKDFVHKMMERFASGQTLNAPTDQIFVPTFIDDIALALERLVARSASGIYHAVGDSRISPYEAAKEIAKTFGYDASLVFGTTFAQFARDRAPLPQYAALTSHKMTNMGITMKTFSDGLLDVKRQEANAGQ
jgi:dTDP-4-dehydrorhamnose reductase